MNWPWLAWIFAAYVIGSIPFGVIIGKLRGIDIREHGSKNIGATNVGRVLGKRFGIICFVLDFLKGASPVIAAGWAMHVWNRHADGVSQAQMWSWLAVAMAAIAGHMFSIFLKFTGGKGVATGFGAMAAMWPLLTIPTLVALVVWYAAVRLTKYVSIASLLAIWSLPVSYLLWEPLGHALDRSLGDTWAAVLHASPPLIGTTLIAMLVTYQHRGNIARLRAGTEPRTLR